MVSNRARARVVLGAVVIGLGGVGAASCGGNASKEARPAGDAGEAGAGDTPGNGGKGGKSGSGGSGAVGNNSAGGANEAGSAGEAPEGGFGGTVNIPVSEAGAGGEGGAVVASCSPVASRITIAFSADDPERITNLQWTNSAAALTYNVIGEGGPGHCTDPQEYFGQSYGAPEGTLPYPVVAGNLATLAHCGTDATITSAAQDCTQAAQMPVTTQYHFYGGARASQMRIMRTVGFDANTPVYANTVGLRPYVPRVSLSGLSTVIYPDQTNSTITTTPATDCGLDCFTPTGTTWNGTWFADIDPNTGLALIVRRDPSMTSPVNLTINYDSYSNANIASFVVLQPTAGWQAPVTEVEYLCFADLTSWPQTMRDTAQLPAGCGP